MSNLHEGQSFFEMLGEYILAGFKVAIIVSAMLIGFIALIAMINGIFSRIRYRLPNHVRLRVLSVCVDARYSCR